ncbi:hypothetical protein ACVBAX_09045 [Robertmurraya sp. GLU-23]
MSKGIIKWRGIIVLEVKEYFKPKLEEILRLAESAEDKLEGYLKTTTEKPEVSAELLKIFYLSDEFVELFNPSKETGEIHGLPKENVLGARYAKQITTKGEMDFTPWFTEKTNNIKKGVKKTIKSLDLDPLTLKLTEDAPMSVEEYILYGIESGLHEVKSYSNTILKMLEKSE